MLLTSFKAPGPLVSLTEHLLQTIYQTAEFHLVLNLLETRGLDPMLGQRRRR